MKGHWVEARAPLIMAALMATAKMVKMNRLLIVINMAFLLLCCINWNLALAHGSIYKIRKRLAMSILLGEEAGRSYSFFNSWLAAVRRGSHTGPKGGA